MKYSVKAINPELRGSSEGENLFTRVFKLIPPQKASRLFADVYLDPGAEIAYHPHKGESEVYYILEGEGSYRDGDDVYPVSSGDITVCPSGSGHGLKNTGDRPLRFIALILKEE